MSNLREWNEAVGQINASLHVTLINHNIRIRNPMAALPSFHKLIHPKVHVQLNPHTSTTSICAFPRKYCLQIRDRRPKNWFSYFLSILSIFIIPNISEMCILILAYQYICFYINLKFFDRHGWFDVKIRWQVLYIFFDSM